MNVIKNQPFHVVADHDGVDTDSYDLLIDGAIAGSQPASALQASVITFSNVTVTKAGSQASRRIYGFDDAGPEEKVMAVNALCSDFTILGDGRVTVTWEDGHSNTFLDLAAVKAYIGEIDTKQDMAERLLLAWFLARQPTGSPVSVVEGKRLTFDISNAQPMRVQ